MLFLSVSLNFFSCHHVCSRHLFKKPATPGSLLSDCRCYLQSWFPCFVCFSLPGTLWQMDILSLVLSLTPKCICTVMPASYKVDCCILYSLPFVSFLFSLPSRLFSPLSPLLSSCVVSRCRWRFADSMLYAGWRRMWGPGLGGGERDGETGVWGRRLHPT